VKKVETPAEKGVRLRKLAEGFTTHRDNVVAMLNIEKRAYNVLDNPSFFHVNCRGTLCSISIGWAAVAHTVCRPEVVSALLTWGNSGLPDRPPK